MKSKRYAQSDRSRCVACGACLNECPRDAIAVVNGCYAVVDTEVCIGCKKCAVICPADCIEMVEREQRDE